MNKIVSALIFGLCAVWTPVHGIADKKDSLSDKNTGSWIIAAPFYVFGIYLLTRAGEKGGSTGRYDIHIEPLLYAGGAVISFLSGALAQKCTYDYLKNCECKKPAILETNGKEDPFLLSFGFRK